jgi:sugar phosphate isomerase/epimerase
MKTLIDIFHRMEYSEMFPLAKNAGFDGVFSGEIYANDVVALEGVAELAQKHGLEWETSHATIPYCETIWSEGDEGERYCDVLRANIDNCRRFGIPLLVVHVSPDFSKRPKFELGIKRLESVVEYAKAAGAKIAFENINSPEYLFDTLAHFNDAHVGFCYDVGHEACHTPGVRYLPKIGDRLFCTHLHDNDGRDDCHWLPFDGVIDFERTARELKTCDYRGNLTLELAYHSHYGKKYTREEFLAEAYSRTKRLQKMINGK